MSVLIQPVSTSLENFFKTKSFSQVAVLVDENTKKFCYNKIKSFLPKHSLIQIKSGEGQKDLSSCQVIWNKMTANAMDRHALFINLGGGVIGDMGGFCAATYKRGIRFIQIPTTLLSQVDASVGGKLGIDFNGFKNHIGVFQLPEEVWVDIQFIETLPFAEKRSGFAEIIKHCLIADYDMWESIRKKDLQDQDLGILVPHSINIKKKVVEEDPKERGLRKILNFGHTLGHAIETFYLDKGAKKLLHGEAIAAGMVMESYLAYTKRFIDAQTLTEIEEFIFSVYGRVDLNEEDVRYILKLTAQDKKNLGGEVRFSLLNGRGSCTFDVSCSMKEMEKAVAFYRT